MRERLGSKTIGFLVLLAALIAPVLGGSAANAGDDSMIPEIQKSLRKLTTYGAFDWLNFSYDEQDNGVTLDGFAMNPTLKKDAERAVKKIKGVETVRNYIEVLPESLFDDRIRTRAYFAIYGHSSLQKYAPGGGLTGFDVRRASSDLRFGVDALQQAKGPHPIHIIVRNGNLMLLGVVANEQDKQIAEIQAKQLDFVFNVVNRLQVEGQENK